MKKITTLIIYIILSCLCCGANAQGSVFGHAENHPFTDVRITYAHEECSFRYSNIDFCDQRHIESIKSSLQEDKPNFFRHYILLPIQKGPDNYFQRSLVLIDTYTGVVYPLPIDSYSGHTLKNSYVTKHVGELSYSLNSNRICILGSIFTHGMVKNGKFCFTFLGDRFSGYKTIYMYE
jgi:hypothetical protein